LVKEEVFFRRVNIRDFQ